MFRLSRFRKTSVTFRFRDPESQKTDRKIQRNGFGLDFFFYQAYYLFLWPLVYELVTCLWIHVWPSNVPWNIWEALTFQQTVRHSCSSQSSCSCKAGGDVVHLSQHVKHILQLFLFIFSCESPDCHISLFKGYINNFLFKKNTWNTTFSLDQQNPFCSIFDDVNYNTGCSPFSPPQRYAWRAGMLQLQL